MSDATREPNRAAPPRTAASAALPGALRVPEPALRYSWPARWSDAAAGRRDAKSDLAASRAGADRAGGAPSVWRVWLARNAHTCAERDSREFLVAQLSAAPLVAQLRRLRLAADQAVQHAELTARRSAEAPRDVPQDLLAARGPAERHDGAEVIAMRRRAVHRQALQALEAATRAAADQAAATAAEVADTAAELESLFEQTRTRSDRLREYHSRRAATYLRAYLRRVHRDTDSSAAAGLPDEADAVLPAPGWTRGACPWTAPAAGLVADENSTEQGSLQ